MNKFSLSVVIAAALGLTTTLANAHGGGLDKYGCHHDRKKGGYHCHGGDKAKRSSRPEQAASKSGALATQSPTSKPATQSFTSKQVRTPAVGEVLSGQVVAITDGDTLIILDAAKNQHAVRLLDIDAPERSQAFGARSRQALTTLCFRKSASVRGREYDRYGRILGQVTCDGVDANAAQVKQGMAWVFVRYASPNSPLYLLEEEAREARRGLWRDALPTAPWDWRDLKSN
jgi:endonuclease YncB( thermonuclease family)